MSDTIAQRSQNGRFLKGNRGGPGNPHADKVAKLKVAMLSAVSEKSMRTVIRKLVEMAEGGDLKAIELLLNRTIGKADASAPVALVQMNGTQCDPPKSGEEIFRGIAERIMARRLQNSQEAGGSGS